MGETRVDLQHLLEDLRDAYSGALEETILTEIVANALDSGATHIRLATNAAEATLTVTDDGRGMQRRELARYHDVAASTKSRGEGIGAGYGTTVIAIVPAVRFPVPVDVTDGVAVTVAVPGAMPRTSPATDTAKTLVLDDSKVIALVCDGCSGFDVPSENVSVTASWITSPTRTVAGPVTWAVTSRLYSPQHAVRPINASATTSVPVRLGLGFGLPEPVGMLHLPTNRRPRAGQRISNSNAP